ncbi:MAG: CaiB/BaiF CoA transferase family protein [Actinomycetota bacterium]
MGPLHGIRVVEIAGIGPGPFAAMMLADMGADVLRVDRIEASDLGLRTDPTKDVVNRGRRSVAVDLKNPQGVAAVLGLVEQADALIEGFRPGVAERLGIGPDECLKRNPRLVYGRITGWGQDGPLAHASGHDINYIALAGALHAIGRRDEPPVPPVNFLGDYGGGGMLLAYGVVCALVETSRSGTGQVVDAAMVDGVAALTAMLYGLRAMGGWRDERGVNVIDTGAPFYDVYQTSDGGYVSIGSLEQKFYAELLTRLDIQDLPPREDPSNWKVIRDRLTTLFKTKTRDEWCALLEGTDICFAPVLSMSEAHEHPHNKTRGTFVKPGGLLQPAPAPRFSRTPGAISGPPARPGEHTEAALKDWGFSDAWIEELRAAGAIG